MSSVANNVSIVKPSRKIESLFIDVPQYKVVPVFELAFARISALSAVFFAPNKGNI